MLTDEDLAYMRETQALARPTEATVRVMGSGTSDGMGGTTSGTLGQSQPLQVRVDDNPDVPVDVAGRYDVPLVKIVADLVDLTIGSIITVPGVASYKVVTTAHPDEWTTAQVVYAVPR